MDLRLLALKDNVLREGSYYGNIYISNQSQRKMPKKYASVGPERLHKEVAKDVLAGIA
jgi:hypothetical protein